MELLFVFICKNTGYVYVFTVCVCVCVCLRIIYECKYVVSIYYVYVAM